MSWPYDEHYVLQYYDDDRQEWITPMVSKTDSREMRSLALEYLQRGRTVREARACYYDTKPGSIWKAYHVLGGKLEWYNFPKDTTGGQVRRLIEITFYKEP